MGERKVLNKYYPPNYDPKAIPRLRRPKDTQYTVRLMAPFNMRCTNCGNFVYKGTKFNATKETVNGETYLGIKIFRFYIRCPKCCSEIAFKTNPKEADYVCEIGATRNFESWRLVDRLGTIEDQIAQEDAEENPMAALEARTKESRQEMDVLDGLEDIKDANARAAKVDLDEVIRKRELEALMKARDQLEREMAEDEELIQQHFSAGKRVIRLLDDEPRGDDGGMAAKFLKMASNLATDILLDDGSEGAEELEGKPTTKKGKHDHDEPSKPAGKFATKSALASLVVRKTPSAAPAAPAATATAGTVSNQSAKTTQSADERPPATDSKATAPPPDTPQSSAASTTAPTATATAGLGSLLGGYGSDESD